MVVTGSLPKMNPYKFLLKFKNSQYTYNKFIYYIYNDIFIMNSPANTNNRPKKISMRENKKIEKKNLEKNDLENNNFEKSDLEKKIKNNSSKCSKCPIICPRGPRGETGPI